MASITVRELRNDGGRVLDRVEQGESLIVTRDGRPVAELRPIERKPLSSEALLERYRHMPYVDPVKLRRDIDELFDTSL